MNCHKHKLPLIAKETMYGTRWKCPAPNCSVACWGGETSTPADAETRKARMECHAAFDPLWRDKVFFQKRYEAYKWLRKRMKCQFDKAHIGMFSLKQCNRLLCEIEKLKASHQGA